MQTWKLAVCYTKKNNYRSITSLLEMPNKSTTCK